MFAQADAGYTKVGTVNSPITSFTDTTVVDGLFYQYQITAFNAVLETKPTSDGVVTIPVTGTHSTITSWTASLVDPTHTAPTGYNIYRQQVTAPNPPGAVSTTVN